MSILKKHTCGQIANSHHLFFTGDLPVFITDSSVLDDRNLNSVIKNIGTEIDDISNNIDLTTLEKNCFDFDKTIVKNKDIHQTEIVKICEHDVRLSDAEAELLEINIFNSIINFDLECLTPEMEECEQSQNEYTLQTILETFVSEVCSLKVQIEELCTSVDGTSGTSGATGTSGVSGTSGAGGNGTSGTGGTSGTSGNTSGVTYYQYDAEPYICGDCAAPIGPTVVVDSTNPALVLFRYYNTIPAGLIVYRPIFSTTNPASFTIYPSGYLSCVEACNPPEE